MQLRNSISSIFLIIALVVIQFPLVVRSQVGKNKTSNTPDKFALLVGINDYIGEINDLSGTHNDVEIIKSLLTWEKFGFVEKKTGGSTADAPCGKQAADSPLKTLCSGQATYAGIINAFKEHLIKNAREYKEKNKVTANNGATVVFYYSGHGSHLPDNQTMPGDIKDNEPDGEDETIVAADGEWEGKNQIRDDEFNKLTSELRQYTNNITFIFDSCHSGTITRGNGAKSFKNIKTKKSSRGNARGDGDDRLTNGIISDKENEATSLDEGYVAVSGSLPNEQSFEDFFPVDPKKPAETRKNGVLTYFLVNYLKQNPGATYREVINQVRNGAESSGKLQTPQAEGSIDRIVFGLSSSGAKIPVFPVCTSGKCSQVVTEKDQKGKDVTFHKIEMSIGELVGAREGGIIAVYNKDARQLVGEENKIGMGKITSADQFNSKADVTLSDKSIKEFPSDAKIVLISPYFTDAKRTLALDYTTSAKGNVAAANKRLDELNVKLKDSPYFNIVKASELLNVLSLDNAKKPDWDFAVVRSSFKDFKTSIAQKTIKQAAANNKGNAPKDDDVGFFLSNKDGDPLYNFWVDENNETAAADIQEALEKHIRLENLRILGNEGSSLKDKIKVEFVRVKDFSIQKFSSEGVPLECKAVEYGESEIIKDQTKTAPQIKFAERRSAGVNKDAGINGDGYYFRITNTSDQKLFIYAYSLSADGEISLLLPPSGIGEEISPGQTITTHKENQCRVFFHTKKGSDIGRETFKFIVTTQVFPGELLTQKKIDNIKGQRGGDSPLANLLTRSRTQQKSGTRGPEEWGGSVSSWTTINKDIEVIQ